MSSAISGFASFQAKILRVLKVFTGLKAPKPPRKPQNAFYYTILATAFHSLFDTLSCLLKRECIESALINLPIQ
jgi:hypothetical protein